MELAPMTYWMVAVMGVIALLAFGRVRRVYAGKPDVAALVLVVLLAALVSWQVALCALAAVVVLSFTRALLRQANIRHG